MRIETEIRSKTGAEKTTAGIETARSRIRFIIQRTGTVSKKRIREICGPELKGARDTRKSMRFQQPSDKL